MMATKKTGKPVVSEPAKELMRVDAAERMVNSVFIMHVRRRHPRIPQMGGAHTARGRDAHALEHEEHPERFDHVHAEPNGGKNA
jgi:hypothetical protein